MLPHSERPAYVPPTRPLNPTTRGAASPAPQIPPTWRPGSVPIVRRPPASAAPASPSASPILLAGGADPVVVANNVNPDRGIVSTFSSPPAPVLTAQVDGPSDSSGAQSGGGIGQLAFLAAAVYVAWLALKVH